MQILQWENLEIISTWSQFLNILFAVSSSKSFVPFLNSSQSRTPSLFKSSLRKAASILSGLIDLDFFFPKQQSKPLWFCFCFWNIYSYKSYKHTFYMDIFQISTHFLRHINRFSPPWFTLVLGVVCESPPGVGGVGQVQQLRLQRVLDEVSLLDLPVYWQNLHIVQVQFNLINCSWVLCRYISRK